MNLIGYLAKGLKMTNENIELFLIYVIFIGIGYINPYLLSYNVRIFFIILSVVITFIFTAFILSIPALIEEKKHHRKINLKKIYTTVGLNTKRAVAPLIALVLMAIAVLFIISMIFVETKLITFNQILGMAQKNSLWSSIAVLAVGSLFQFTSIFFSIKKQNLLEAIKNSIVTSVHHLPFVGMLFLLDLIFHFATNFLPVKYPFVSATIAVLGAYYAVVIAATALTYYKEVVKK